MDRPIVRDSRWVDYAVGEVAAGRGGAACRVDSMQIVHLKEMLARSKHFPSSIRCIYYTRHRDFYLEQA
jgi:hypothetical protein